MASFAIDAVWNIEFQGAHNIEIEIYLLADGIHPSGRHSLFAWYGGVSGPDSVRRLCRDAGVPSVQHSV